MENKAQVRDLAAHLLAIFIEALGYKNCSDPAKKFLTYLFESRKNLSVHCFTHCMMYLLKTNELAEKFTNKGGFNELKRLLLNECREDHRIAYNTCTILWILSSNKFAIEPLCDFTLNIIQHAAKLLDFFNKENIVRIICQFFDVSTSIRD